MIKMISPKVILTILSSVLQRKKVVNIRLHGQMNVLSSGFFYIFRMSMLI